MMLLTLFIVGHMEIGNGYCRTEMMMQDEVISMEYPCEYYSELRDLESFIEQK